MSKEQEEQKNRKIIFNTIKHEKSINKKITKKKGENNRQQKNERKIRMENLGNKYFGKKYSSNIKNEPFASIKVDLLKLNSHSQNNRVKELEEEDNIIKTDQINNKNDSKMLENNKTQNIIYPTFLNKNSTYSKFI